VIDTRTVVTRGTGEQRCPRGDINRTDTRSQIVGSTYHGPIQTPKSWNMHVPCPCDGSTHVKHRSNYPLCVVAIGPESALMNHWIRVVSKGFSGDSIRITVDIQKIGLR